jgi:signal transduction histidine kinase
MLAGGSSTAEYTIGDEPAKIVAYVPLQMNNKKWVLAISTFLPEVTAALRGKFNMFFGLGIVILIFIFLFGLLLYFINAKRIRAEESNRMLEQRQHFQDQLNHAAKLASIGELVDTVAHEINTPLGIISSHADALLLQKDYPKKFHEDLDVIKNQTKRASKYTRSLLGYSQRMPFRPAQNSLTSLIDDCLYLLAHRIKVKRASIIKNYADGISRVYMDKGQMEQVIINLLNNSLDAIKPHGEIKIETGLETDTLPGSSTVCIKITDNGSGIAPENLENIFEPFFTTKAPNEGTGLGLSISRAIINRHRGKLEAGSEKGKFTTFKISLPDINNQTEK